MTFGFMEWETGSHWNTHLLTESLLQQQGYNTESVHLCLDSLIPISKVVN